MEKSELSRIYFLATSRISEFVGASYEALHNGSGDPHTSIEDVYDVIRKIRSNVELECDMMRQALIEYHEQTESRQTKIF